MPLGLYISVPFCRTKCSFCNFASGVFSRQLFDRYVERICADIEGAESLAREMGGRFEREVDSIYLGGGTPTILDPGHLDRIFAAVHANFSVAPNAEITIECAPGTLSPEMLDALVRCGVDRVSLGVQSFLDLETRSVGRLHTREITFSDIARLRAAGISNISVDLIAGLPHQTEESWRQSLDDVVNADVPHVSVYMLEVDRDSRLGRELIAGGARYHAHFVPDEDATAGFYEQACESLDRAGIQQYEISNFARSGCESNHNLKYWRRHPYLGFGVDAHSMLKTSETDRDAASHESQLQIEAIRFATPDDLDAFLAATPHTRTAITCAMAEDEAFFLGLRLNRGIDIAQIARQFGDEALSRRQPQIEELLELALLEPQPSRIRLTPKGRLLSNEVFERLSLAESAGTE